MAPDKLSLLKGSRSRDDPVEGGNSSEAGGGVSTFPGSSSSSTPDGNHPNKKMALSSRDQSLDCPTEARAWANQRADSTSSEFGNLTTYEVIQSPNSTTLGASSTDLVGDEELAGRMSALDVTDRQEMDYQEPSTSYDVSSRQLDDSDLESLSVSIISQSTIAAADDVASANVASANVASANIASAPVKKEISKKQQRAKRKELARRIQWEKRFNASDAQVLEHILMNKGSIREWRAVAQARGICSLSAGCRCADCQAGYLEPNVNEEDAGLGAGAHIISDAFGHDMAPVCVIL